MSYSAFFFYFHILYLKSHNFDNYFFFNSFFFLFSPNLSKVKGIKNEVVIRLFINIEYFSVIITSFLRFNSVNKLLYSILKMKITLTFRIFSFNEFKNQISFSIFLSNKSIQVNVILQKIAELKS